MVAACIYLLAFGFFLEAVHRAPLIDEPEPADEFFARMRELGVGR